MVDLNFIADHPVRVSRSGYQRPAEGWNLARKDEWMMSDTQFSKSNGWMVQVWFPTSKMHSVRIINPAGRPIPLAGPGQFEFGGLNESKVAELLVRVGQLLPSDSDAEAIAKIRQ